MATYLTQANLEDRLSVAVVRAILDDNADGTVDTGPLGQVLADAEAYCEGFARGIYDLTVLRALGTNAPTEWKRMCLDVAGCYLLERWPEYIRGDLLRMWERARTQLLDLRKGLTRLNIGTTPEPAANQGGEVRSGDPEDSTPADPVFTRPDSFDLF